MDQGFEVSSRSVLRLLHRLGYSLQANAKVAEGRQHPDRDAQFHHLNDTATAFIDDGQPVISVDSKKKELIGNYANGRAEWAPSGDPERTNVHDFADRALGEFGKAIPYGIYDVFNNEGWVNVGDCQRSSISLAFEQDVQVIPYPCVHVIPYPSGSGIHPPGSLFH